MRRLLTGVILILLYQIPSFASPVSGNDSTRRIMPIIFNRCASPLSFEMMPYFKSSVRNISIGGDALFQSNAIMPSFLYSIYNSEFIDNDKKAKQFDRLRAKNGAGLEAATGLSFSWKRDSSRFTHSFGLYERSINQLKFSDGLYYLTFFGNGHAEGAVIDMGNNEANFMQFAQLQYSFKYDASPAVKVYGGISFLAGQNYQHALLKGGSLFTDTLGESVTVGYDFNYQGNNGINNWYGMTGQGFSIDGGIIITKDPTRYVFSAGFSDLSYITWNSKTTLYAASGSKKFEGLEVANLFAITDTTFKNINKDSILHYFNIAQKKGKAYDELPFGLNVAYQFRTTEDFIWSFRASYKPDFYWYPRLEVRGGKFFSHGRYCIMLNAGAGGFETFFAGASLYGNFILCPSSSQPKYLSIYLTSDHITSLFLPDDMMGASARVGVELGF